MPVKTILVGFADPARAHRLLEAAAPLAEAHGAHVIGLCVVPPYVVIPAAEGAGMSVTLDEHRTSYAADIIRMKTQFTEAMRGRSFPYEWREADAAFGTVAGEILAHARGADLVIIGQDDDDWTYGAVMNAADRVAIEAGRPVLVVPKTGPVATPVQNALVAWNGRREAARAAFDALSLLAPGASITVVWVDTPADPADGGDAVGSDIAAALTRHGMRCDATRLKARGGDITETLLSEARARGASLVVMGAYGHSRVREFILGGASRGMLERMDRLVLMSH